MLLRLWGDHGQACLEAAHICVINATGLGTEILKSLVLPGIGAFTIVDGKKITDEDIGAKYARNITLTAVLQPRDTFQCDVLNGFGSVSF